MDIVEIERTLTAWIAERLTFTIDKNIFRGEIPTGKTGVAVILNDEIPEAVMFRPRTYNWQVLGKFKDRDAAMRILAKLSALLPMQEVTIGNIHFKSLSRQGGGEPYKADDNGRVFWYVSFNALAVVLTKGVQV